MAPLKLLIEQANDDADAYDLELSALGTDDPSEIAELLERLLSARLTEVQDGLFYRRGTGVVTGVLLADGREVVIKAHRWNASSERLRAVQEVQRQLVGAGLPAPTPLCAPEPLGRGVVTVEALRRGGSGNAHEARTRREIAELLRSLVVAAAPLASLDALGEAPLFGGTRRWPEPHDLRFDFEATAVGAEWIDELAWQARQRVAEFDGDRAVGHMDWRVGNLGFDAGRCSAIYDWDSLGVATEPVVVGAASAQFSADWARGLSLPDLGEMRAFVADYERARGTPFDATERRVLDAANLVQCAYGARCQHSDVALGLSAPSSAGEGWLALLRHRSESPRL